MPFLQCFFAIIMLLVCINTSLQLESYFGKGYCLSDHTVLDVDITGPRMCVTACDQNTNCVTVNYIKDFLRCVFLSIDSNVTDDFDSDPKCVHYRSTSQQMNSSDQCGPCPEYSTCVTLRRGNTYCVRTSCKSPIVIHGVVAPGTLEVGVTRDVNCDTDYEFLDGSMATSVVCLSDGSWTKAQPMICKLQECPEPTNPVKGMITAGNNTIGSIREVQCNPGYAMIGGESHIECKSGKVWTSWTGTCSLCSEPPAIPNAVVAAGGVTIGSQRSYSCQTDYVDNGEPNNILCHSNAQWTATTFTCSLAECPEPSPFTNAVILAGSNEIGSQRAIECSPGYAMTGTSQIYIACQSGQIWSKWTGSCVTCSEPIPITNAAVSAGSVTVGSTRTYSCNSGYGSNGHTDTITCGSDAQWSSTSFACLPECPSPIAPSNGYVESGSNTVGARRSIQCNSGYARIGSQTYIECLSSRVWTAWSGSCSTCPNPSSISYATISSGSVTVGSTRSYSCNSWYTSNGNSGTITCQSDATWSATSFACVCSGTVRLSSGLLQVCHNNVWGTVCDDSFTNVAAAVACRSLGYGTGTVYTHGGGSGTIWMDNVVCGGSESHIFQCSHNGWGSHNCGHHEDVGLNCS